jgi:hypothetical protein
MLDGIKRLFSGPQPTSANGWDDIATWATSLEYTYREVASEGFVIDGRLGANPWRLEWGPSQRPYIQGQELRLRAELGLVADLQVVLMNRNLQEAMERTVFEQYVEGVQTRIDNQTPPEMRWLVMFPKLSALEMGALNSRYVALSSIKAWLMQWLEGPLSQAVQSQRVEPATPLVLMIGRGRLMLRTAMPDMSVLTLKSWLRLFETAMRESRRVASETGDTLSPSTSPSLWSASALPGDERKT